MKNPKSSLIGPAFSHKDKPTAESRMGRLKIRLNRARNLRGPELINKEDCYFVFTFNKKRVLSSVKYGTVAPVWDQDYYIDNVPFPPPSNLAITLVYKGEKMDDVLGVAAPKVDLWTKGNEQPVDKWLAIVNKDGIYAGEVNFHIHWTESILSKFIGLVILGAGGLLLL